MSAKIKFRNRAGLDFYTTLQERVRDYFESNGISPYANWKMIFKAVFFFTGFAGLYILIILDIFNPFVLLLLCMLLGLFVAFVGFNIAHDATHNSFSKFNWVNKVLAYTFNLAGANQYMWRIMHNIIHHTYTNIAGHDADLEPVSIIRLNAENERKKIHRYQHWYASILYALSSLSWVFKKDFLTFFKKKIGNYENKKHPWYEYLILFFSKAVYLFMFIGLPIILLSVPWWQVLIGFFVLHLVEGATLAFVFQLAHVVEIAEFPNPSTDGNMQNSWAIHQVTTTSNFARNNRLITFLLGGLNFQVEHHLFPNICHIHYRKISDIVKTTAEEFNIRYNEYRTMWQALQSHFRLLKRLGREDQLLLS